jgi:hypothetical protein
MSKNEACSDYLSEVIESFRLGREGQGSTALAKVIDFMAPRMEQHAAELTQDDVALINEVLAAQERGDYLFVADILEYLLPTSILGKMIAEQQNT